MFILYSVSLFVSPEQSYGIFITYTFKSSLDTPGISAFTTTSFSVSKTSTLGAVALLKKPKGERSKKVFHISADAVYFSEWIPGNQAHTYHSLSL